jgi:hypothetical protein
VIIQKNGFCTASTNMRSEFFLDRQEDIGII